MDYLEKGKLVKYQFGSIIFEGVISFFDPNINHYCIEVKKWIGKGYPHLIYWSTKDKLTFI